MNPFGHGFHLDRAAFDEMLRSGVAQSLHSNTCVIKGKFKGVEKDSESNWVIHADVDGEATTFFARWVIDATGRKASLATKVSRSCSHAGCRISTSSFSLVHVQSRRIHSSPSTQCSQAPRHRTLPIPTMTTAPSSKLPATVGSIPRSCIKNRPCALWLSTHSLHTRLPNTPDDVTGSSVSCMRHPPMYPQSSR
jgi:hypothetical protein